MKNVTINLLDYFWKKGIKPIKEKLGKLKEVAFSGKYSDLSGTPNALKNPNALTFTGAVTGSYDGSDNKSVKIPSVTNNLLATQPGTALDAVQGKVLDDKIGTINGSLANKADTNTLPYGFRDINAGLWGNDVPQIDDANAGLSVHGAPTSEYTSCDTWYYFTFYESGNNNKSYGIQLAIPRYSYTGILLRQKLNGAWVNWEWI